MSSSTPLPSLPLRSLLSHLAPNHPAQALALAQPLAQGAPPSPSAEMPPGQGAATPFAAALTGAIVNQGAAAPPAPPEVSAIAQRLPHAPTVAAPAAAAAPVGNDTKPPPDHSRATPTEPDAIVITMPYEFVQPIPAPAVTTMPVAATPDTSTPAAEPIATAAASHAAAPPVAAPVAPGPPSADDPGEPDEPSTADHADTPRDAHAGLLGQPGGPAIQPAAIPNILPPALTMPPRPGHSAAPAGPTVGTLPGPAAAPNPKPAGAIAPGPSSEIPAPALPVSTSVPTAPLTVAPLPTTIPAVSPGLSASSAGPVTPPPSPVTQLAPAFLALSAPGSPEAPQRLVIRLDPAALGHVQVSIDRNSDGTSHVVLAVERTDTLLLLLQDRPQLDRTLDAAGIAPDGRTVQYSLADPGPGTTGQAASGGSTSAGSGGGSSDPRSGGNTGTGSWSFGQDSPGQDRRPPTRTAWQRAGIDITA